MTPSFNSVPGPSHFESAEFSFVSHRPGGNIDSKFHSARPKKKSAACASEPDVNKSLRYS